MNDTPRQSQKMLAKLLRFIGTSGAGIDRDPAGGPPTQNGAEAVRLVSADGRTLHTTVAIIDQARAAGLIADLPAATDLPPSLPSQSSSPPSKPPSPAPSRSSLPPPVGIPPRTLASRHGLTLLPAARAFLRRAAADAEEVFLAQHTDVVAAVAEVDGIRQAVRLDQSESPLAGLVRLKDRSGAPFLPAEAVAAGERLAADFTRGQLQPRVTASWEPRLSTAASGARGGMADVADSAMAARLAVNRAATAMGPELSGVALDICCFMKGLATVERERQWPARSAKLMLRTALLALSRHYWPPRPETSGRIRRWGAEGYRPDWL